MNIRYWPEINTPDGVDLGACPKCGEEGEYQPTQMELDDVPFAHAQGDVKCTFCGLSLPIEARAEDYE